ncbi:hypothetical protein BJ912DRAFT_1056848 [Pholiota molesta]|nr:hypothetical protein BJ912DRAFT_1056848 [Pholiota molesta]
MFKFFTSKSKRKLDEQASKDRKERVIANIAHNQAIKAAKKTQLQGEAAMLPADHRYGKPRKPKYNKTGAGFRKEGRDLGHRLPKQPKTPQPNFAEGEHLAHPKAQRRADGHQKFGAVAAIHKETLKPGNNMPGRRDEYHVPQHGVLNGSDVRQGAFHLARHDGKGGKYPVDFRNDVQGSPTNRHRPLPNMNGNGLEYPIQRGGGGYHHPGDPPGPARAIYQRNPQAANGGHKGYNLQGVVAHDGTRGKSHQGYNDHFPVHRVAHEHDDRPLYDIRKLWKS